MLKINGLSKSFDGHKVLDNITFEITKSKIIGLAGGSGSGKSTLLKLIQQLETPDSGTIKSNVRTGFMFQDFQLFPHMTAWQNIVYAPSIRKSSQDYTEEAKKIIKRLGLSKKINSYPGQLSGGQKQRVALARTLIMNPDILLCDEPTSGLDVASTQDVILLMESVKILGVGIVIASHDLDFLTKIADTIFVLRNGTLTDPIHPKTLQDPVSYLRNMYYETE